jgi:hypothetical protein
MKIKGLKYLFIFITTSGFLFSCSGGDKENNESNNNDSVNEHVDSALNNDQQINNDPLISDDYEFIPPSPLQIASIFKKAGLEYIHDLPNSVENADDYNDKFQQSVNFGMYSSDLAYCVENEKYDDASQYLKVIRKLGSKIGLETVFQDEDIITRFENNIGKYDSIVDLLIYVQENTDSYIEDNGMDDLSVIYFTGAWVEGMYLGAKTLNDKNNNLGILLSEQMTIAEILIGGIKHIKDKSDDIYGLQEYITDIIDTYDNLESIKKYGEDIEYIDVELTDEEIQLISSKIIELRETLIQ